VAVAGYLGRRKGFEQALAAFATRHADKNQRDFESLEHAAAAGRITVTAGV
jgi:hypothetical protein